MEGKPSRPACPGGQHSLQFRSSLIFSTFSKHMEGQRKLLCGHTSETSVSATWPLGADALTHWAGNTRQWPGAWPLSLQPAFAKKALNVSHLSNPNLHAPLPASQRPLEVPCPNPGSSREQRWRSRFIYLTLLNFLLFFFNSLQTETVKSCA